MVLTPHDPIENVWPDVANHPGIVQRMLDAMPMIVFVLDQERHLIYANPACAAALECRMEDIQEAVARLQEKDRQPLRNAIVHVLQNHTEVVINRVRAHQGKWRTAVLLCDFPTHGLSRK